MWMDRVSLMGNRFRIVVRGRCMVLVEHMGRKTVWDLRGAGYPDLQACRLAQFGARFIGHRYGAKMPMKQG